MVINTDISGFTAWSSQREPPQVFALLETIYGAFDKIAYRHSVMKIETVGDCYVAACGLPEPREEYVLSVVGCCFRQNRTPVFAWRIASNRSNRTRVLLFSMLLVDLAMLCW